MVRRDEAEREFLGWLLEEELWSLDEARDELVAEGIAPSAAPDALVRLCAEGLIEVVEVPDGDLVTGEISGRRLTPDELRAALAIERGPGWPPLWVAPTDSAADLLGVPRLPARQPEPAGEDGPGVMWRRRARVAVGTVGWAVWVVGLVGALDGVDALDALAVVVGGTIGLLAGGLGRDSVLDGLAGWLGRG